MPMRFKTSAVVMASMALAFNPVSSEGAAPARTEAVQKKAVNQVIRANADSFEAEVLKSDRAVLVEFGADWCPPCKALTAVLDDVAAKNPDIKVVRVSVDDSAAVAMRYGVRALPTLVVFKNGTAVAKNDSVLTSDDANLWADPLIRKYSPALEKFVREAPAPTPEPKAPAKAPAL